MRDDVFHTDEATSAALTRLRGANIGADKLRAFQERAARAVTPAQIEAMEQELRR